VQQNLKQFHFVIQAANSFASVGTHYEHYRSSLDRDNKTLHDHDVNGKCTDGRNMGLLGEGGAVEDCTRCGEERQSWAKGEEEGCTDIICENCYDRQRNPITNFPLGDLLRLRKNNTITYTKIDNFPAGDRQTRSGEPRPEHRVDCGGTVTEIHRANSSVPSGMNAEGEIAGWRDTMEFAIYIYLSNGDIFGISYYPPNFREIIGPPWRGWDYVIMREREEGVGMGMPESIMIQGKSRYTLDPDSIHIV
jgi:hypothetical protein